MRLLLAEDERELSNALCVILLHNHYTVDAVYDGQEALEYARSGTYDGIILDIMMPRLDGLTVLHTLRTQGFAVPVLLLTAKSQVEDRIVGLDGGADDYLVKPFAMEELLARIRAMTRRRGGFPSNLLSLKDITLSRETYILQGPKGAIRLGSKEFQILELLMEQPGRLFSSEQFLTRIWGYDTEAEIGVVWVYISGLRKKLRQVGASLALKVNRGTGYLLEPIRQGRPNDTEVKT